MHLSRSSSNVPRPPSFWEMLENPHRLLTFDKVHNPVCRPRETTSERPKALRTRQFFALLTWKCALRHNRVHFLNISTSKVVLNVFWTFWLGNALRAATACTFSTCQLPRMVRTWCALHILTWKCALHGVHFFDISTSKSGPTLVFCTFWLGDVLGATTARACNSSSLLWPQGSAPAALASLLFDPPEPQAIGTKHSLSRLSYLFAHLHLLSSHAFSSLIFSLLLFSSLTILTAFASVHIVGSLTSKLPSIIHLHSPRTTMFHQKRVVPGAQQSP